jgi:hypothetical protein
MRLSRISITVDALAADGADFRDEGNIDHNVFPKSVASAANFHHIALILAQ